jgi:hypothetical protein
VSLFLVICVCRVRLPGGCQVAARSWWSRSVDDLGVTCTGIAAVGTTLLRRRVLGKV